MNNKVIIMKSMKLTLLFLAIILAIQSKAQKDWSKVDFDKEYKRSSTIKGSAAKLLSKNKVFIAGYTISQATEMKGSETSSALQSGSSKSVFAEAELGGINREDYQQMVDKLFQDLVSELTAAGLNITNGDEIIASSYAQKQLAKGDKKIYIGTYGENPSYEGKRKLTDGSILGYPTWAVIRDLSFPPTNTNYYSTNKLVYGNFYQKLAESESCNLLYVSFKITFAFFDGGRGYKDVKLATKPAIAVKATVGLANAKGGGQILYKKDVWGSDAWVKEMGKTKDNQSTADFFGLARSADYAIIANSDDYLSEVNAIISNLQKDIVKGIKESL